MGQQILWNVAKGCIVGVGLASLLGGLPRPVLAQYSSSSSIGQGQQQLNDLLREGRDLVDSGDYQEAINVYQQAAYIDRSNPRIYSGIGYLYTEVGNFAEAATAYEQAVNLAPDNGPFYHAYGYALAQLGKYDKATIAYQKALDINPKHLESYMGLGIVYMRQGKYDKALEVYQKAVYYDPKDGSVYGLMATALLEQDKRVESLNTLRKAVQWFPYNSQLWLQLAVFLLGIDNDRQGAIDALHQAGKLEPRNPELQLRIGQIFAEQGNLEESEKFYYRALLLQEDSLEAQLEIGDMLFFREAYMPAIVAYRRATELDPKNAKAYHYLGLALMARERPEEGFDFIRKAIAIYEEEGKTGEAEHLKKLLMQDQINPEQPNFVPFN